ncbi:hypothetical protein Tco_1235803 [Tanacetum coccineum]
MHMSAVREHVTPYVVDMIIEMGKHNSLDDIIILGSFPPLFMSVTITVGNALGKSSYANITGKPSKKKVNVCTLYKLGGNGIDVVVSVDSIHAISKYGLVRSMFSSSTRLFSFQFNFLDRLDDMLENGPCLGKPHGVPVTDFSEDGLSAIATKLGTPLMLDSYTTDWGRSSYAILGTPLMIGEGHYTCNVRVEYEWKPPRCSSCKVFRHIHEECPKNTGAFEKKTVKKHSQTSRGVLVGLKMWFKPQKEYRHVPKKPNTSFSGNKNKGVEPTIEVSNSNSFDALISVNNDVEFGTNGGITNLVSNGATSCGSSFMNIDNDGEFASNTPIVPLGIVESDSEVEVVFDEATNLRISTSGKDGSDKCYGTNSLLEQWRDSYLDNHDYDLYDDDMSNCNLVLVVSSYGVVVLVIFSFCLCTQFSRVVDTLECDVDRIRKAMDSHDSGSKQKEDEKACLLASAPIATS